MTDLNRIVELLEDLHGLEDVELSLAGANLHDDEISSVLCPAMRDTKRGLTGTLDLSENPVLTDEAIIRICGAIEKKRMLFIDSIMLNNCSKIHDRSARALGKVIRNTLANSSRVLSIRGTAVHDDGTAELLAALREKQLSLRELHLGRIGIQGLGYLLSFLETHLAKEHLEVLTIEAILATDNVGLEEKYQRQPDEDPRTIDTSAFGKRENSENAEVDDDDDNEEGEEADEKRKMEERRTKWEQSMREKLDHIDSIEVDAFEDDIELPENCSRSGSTSRTTRRLEELLRSLQDAVEECTKITCMDIRCDEFPWIHDATKILAVEHKLQIDRIAAFGNGMTEDSSVNSSDASDETLSDREYIKRNVVPSLTRAVHLCEEQLLRKAPAPVDAQQQLAFIAAVLKGAI